MVTATSMVRDNNQSTDPVEAWPVLDQKSKEQQHKIDSKRLLETVNPLGNVATASLASIIDSFA